MRFSFSPIARAGLLALAVVGAAGAQAQSNVTLYGLIDMSVGRFQAPGEDAISKVESGSMTTSFWGLKGLEDLGGGLNAQFVLEGFMRNDTGAAGRYTADAFWSRSAWVGLAGPFGAVTMGRNTTSLFVSTVVFNPFGDSFGFSPTIRHYFTSGTTTGDTGWSDSIKYTSPSFGGASFTAHTALGEANGGANSGLSATWSGGPAAATFAWQKVKKGASTDDTTTWNAGVTYDLGMVKLYGQYGKVDNKTIDNSCNITGLGFAVPIGLGKVLAEWGRVSPDAGSKLTTLTVGYDYQISKRTDLYAVAMHDKLEDVKAGKSGALGIRHRF